MCKLFGLVVWGLSWVAASAMDDSRQAFDEAAKLRASDPEQAILGMRRSFELAVASGNVEMAAVAGLNVCGLIHAREQSVEAGKAAREIIAGLNTLTAEEPFDAVRRAQIFGFVQTGLQAEGRIGEACRANRATAEILRGKNVSATADGPAITVGEVKDLQGQLRGLGWRAVLHEAQLLDLTGRTNQARTLLDESAVYFSNDWPSLTEHEQFYAYKLLGYRALVVDFLGYQEEAIAMERELVALAAGRTDLQASPAITEINLLYHVSQWEGPSQALIDQARELSIRSKALGATIGSARLLAKMEFDLQASTQPLEVIAQDLKNNLDQGNFLEATYAERDLLSRRAKSGEAGLENDFAQLLEKLRAQGNKRAEPNVYRDYGKYLLTQNRPADACIMYAEALRLTRAFGWTLHEAPLLVAWGNVCLAAGDLPGARAILTELDAFLRQHPELPAAKRVAAEIGRANILSQLGDEATSKAALDLARETGRDLPAYQLRLLTREAEAAVLAKTPRLPKFGGKAFAPQVQPLEVVTLAAPGENARTRFAVANHSASRVHGAWQVRGPGIVKTAERSVTGVAGQPITTLKLPAAMAPGAESVLNLALSAAGVTDKAQLDVLWQTDETTAVANAAWHASWDPAAKNSTILDASSLQADPFRFVSLFHELAAPIGEDQGIPFRLRSPVPLRMEYYDAKTQQLLAIDANGNGDFSEIGDLHLRGHHGVAAALVPALPTAKNVTVEIHLFAPDGQAIATPPTALTLVAEIYQNGKWAMQAENTLR